MGYLRKMKIKSAKRAPTPLNIWAHFLEILHELSISFYFDHLNKLISFYLLMFTWGTTVLITFFFKKSCKNVYLRNTGWVVTWFLLGYTVRMFEYTVRTFWSNVGRFLYVFSSIPRKLYTIFQPTFSPIKRYQDSIFKLLTLSTNSVTNVVRTAYFQIQARSSQIKDFVTESILKVRSFMRIFWHR